MEGPKSMRAIIAVSVIVLVIGAASFFYLHFNSGDILLHANFSDKEKLRDFTRANNGSIQGEPKILKEFMGYALEFDGKSYVDCGSTAEINEVKDAVTVEAWIKPKNLVTGKSNTVILLKGAYNFGLTRDERAGTSDLVFGYINGGGVHTVRAYVRLETWNYVVLVYDRSLPDKNIKIYVDGVLRGQTDYREPIVAGTENVFIGGNGTSNFSGLIGEAKINNRALTEEEIKNKFKQGV